MKALKDKRSGLRSFWRGGLVILSILALAFVVACGNSGSGDPTTPGNGNNSNGNNGNNGNGNGTTPPPPVVLPVVQSLWITTQPAPGVSLQGARPNLEGMVVRVLWRDPDGSERVQDISDPSEFNVVPPLVLAEDVTRRDTPVNDNLYWIAHPSNPTQLSTNAVRLQVIRGVDSPALPATQTAVITGRLYEDEWVTAEGFEGAKLDVNYEEIDLSMNMNLDESVRLRYERSVETIQLDQHSLNEGMFWQGIDRMDQGRNRIHFTVFGEAISLPANNIARIRRVTAVDGDIEWGRYFQYVNPYPEGVETRQARNDWWIREYFEKGGGRIRVEYDLPNSEAKVRNWSHIENLMHRQQRELRSIIPVLGETPNINQANVRRLGFDIAYYTSQEYFPGSMSPEELGAFPNYVRGLNVPVYQFANRINFVHREDRQETTTPLHMVGTNMGTFLSNNSQRMPVEAIEAVFETYKLVAEYSLGTSRTTFDITPVFWNAEIDRPTGWEEIDATTISGNTASTRNNKEGTRRWWRDNRSNLNETEFNQFEGNGFVNNWFDGTTPPRNQRLQVHFRFPGDRNYNPENITTDDIARFGMLDQLAGRTDILFGKDQPANRAFAGLNARVPKQFELQIRMGEIRNLTLDVPLPIGGWLGIDTTDINRDERYQFATIQERNEANLPPNVTIRSAAWTQIGVTNGNPFNGTGTTNHVTLRMVLEADTQKNTFFSVDGEGATGGGEGVTTGTWATGARGTDVSRSQVRVIGTGGAVEPRNLRVNVVATPASGSGLTAIPAGQPSTRFLTLEFVFDAAAVLNPAPYTGFTLTLPKLGPVLSGDFSGLITELETDINEELEKNYKGLEFVFDTTAEMIDIYDPTDDGWGFAAGDKLSEIEEGMLVRAKTEVSITSSTPFSFAQNIPASAIRIAGDSGARVSRVVRSTATALDVYIDYPRLPGVIFKDSEVDFDADIQPTTGSALIQWIEASGAKVRLSLNPSGASGTVYNDAFSIPSVSWERLEPETSAYNPIAAATRGPAVNREVWRPVTRPQDNAAAQTYYRATFDLVAGEVFTFDTNDIRLMSRVNTTGRNQSYIVTDSSGDLADDTNGVAPPAWLEFTGNFANFTANSVIEVTNVTAKRVTVRITFPRTT